VTTQNGSVRLPGALVTLRDLSGREIANRLSDADGRFRFADLPEGHAIASASLDGFQATDVSVAVAAGRTVEQAIDLPIASVSKPSKSSRLQPSSRARTRSAAASLNSRELDQLAAGGGFNPRSGCSPASSKSPAAGIKGSRPSQASVQLGSSTLIRSGNRPDSGGAARRCD
jgi:hypothetical protein